MWIHCGGLFGNRARVPGLGLRGSLLACALLGVVFAGCLGGDDGPDPRAPSVTEETGAVSGRVMDANLNPIVGGFVALLEGDSETVATQRTDEDGYYVLNQVPPGSYRLHVSSICCRDQVMTVDVVAGEVLDGVDVMLDLRTALEQQNPWNTGALDFSGFINCMVNQVNVCQDNLRRHGVRVDPGLKTATVGLQWATTGGPVGAEEFTLSVYNRVGGSHLLGQKTGTSPFEFTLDDSVIQDESMKFRNFEDSEWNLMFEVMPVEGDVVYQQAFTIWWTFHYWEPAPPGYSTLPDQ